MAKKPHFGDENRNILETHFFYKNRASSLFYIYWRLTSCKKSLVNKNLFRVLTTVNMRKMTFFHFAHYDRQQWFLGGNGGFSCQKIFWGPNWAHFWHVSKLLLSPNSLSWLLFTSFFYFAYYDRKQWFLVGSGGFSRPNFFGLNLDLSPNYLCLQIRFIDLRLLTFCFLTFFYYFITILLIIHYLASPTSRLLVSLGKKYT